jgi:hypothetical protein
VPSHQSASATTWLAPYLLLLLLLLLLPTECQRQVVDASSANVNLLNDLKKPGPGTHVLTIDGSKPVVELVIQNDRAGLYGKRRRGVHTPRTLSTHQACTQGAVLW